MISSRSRTSLALCLALIFTFSATASAVIGLTALENAVHKGDIKKVKELLDKGADVNEFKYGTALMIAAQEGRLEIARLLIERGADLNIRSNMGWTALGMAADAGKIDMVDMLIAKGADVDAAVVGIRQWAEWTAGPPVRSQSKAQQILKAIGVVQGRAGFAYYSSAQYEKALAVFQARVKDNPNDVQVWLGLAFSSAALKKYDDAKAAADAAIKLDPNSAEAHMALGDALTGKGDAASAIAPLKKAVELDSKNPWGFNRLGMAYYTQVVYPEAISSFRKASELAPNEQAFLRNVMNTCGRSGDFDGAIAAGDRLLTLLAPKDSVEVLGYRSILYREKGMPAQAAVEAGRAAAIDAAHEWTRTSVAALALDKGNYEEALRQISGVTDKSFALARVIEATAHAKNGDILRAEQIYAGVGGDAVSSPNLVVARNARALADLLRPVLAGRLEKATALEGGPEYRQAVAEYGLALKTADAAGAKMIRTRVAAILKAHPEVGELPEDARKYVMRAEVLVDEKKPGEALPQYAEALRLAPFYPNTYYNMAVLSANLGQFKEAVRLMRGFLDLAPEAKNAREATDLTYKWEFMLERASGKQ